MEALSGFAARVAWGFISLKLSTEPYFRMRDHLSSLRTSVFFEVSAILVFVVLVWLVDGLLAPRLEGMGLVLAGLVLALVPAGLWLFAFYRQDHLEPEPKHFVVGLFGLGLLLALAMGEPVLDLLFPPRGWAHAGPLLIIVGAVFTTGLVQEFLKYAAVRYTVYTSQECDEVVDGIIYGASAGLGYATALNVQYVIVHGGVDLGVGALHVAIAALAHASFGGVSGYFLGRARCGSMGPWWLPAGVLLAAALNGLVTYVLRQAPAIGGSFDYNPWYGMLAAIVLGGGTFAVLFVLIRRLQASGRAVRALA